jgi:hypothetical protein
MCVCLLRAHLKLAEKGKKYSDFGFFLSLAKSFVVECLGQPYKYACSFTTKGKSGCDGQTNGPFYTSLLMLATSHLFLQHHFAIVGTVGVLSSCLVSCFYLWRQGQGKDHSLQGSNTTASRLGCLAPETSSLFCDLSKACTDWRACVASLGAVSGSTAQRTT